MLIFSWLKNTLFLIWIKSLRKLNGPFCSFLTKISDNYRFLSAKFYRTGTKIKNIWKIYHSSLSNSINWNNKFLSFGYNNQFIFIINFSFRWKSDYKFCLHTCSNFRSTLHFIICFCICRKQNLKQFWIGLYYFHSSWESVFISEFEYFFFYLERLVIAEANDRRNSLEEWLIDTNIWLCVDRVVS